MYSEMVKGTGSWCCSLLLVFAMGMECQTAGAQSLNAGQARQWYEKETIRMQGNQSYVKNNVAYTGSGNLKREFSISPRGMELYLRSRKNRNIGAVISLVGAAGSITALLSGNRSRVRTFFWVGLGTGTISGLLNARATQQLNEAVWLRNRDALLFLETEAGPGGGPMPR